MFDFPLPLGRGKRWGVEPYPTSLHLSAMERDITVRRRERKPVYTIYMVRSYGGNHAEVRPFWIFFQPLPTSSLKIANLCSNFSLREENA